MRRLLRLALCVALVGLPAVPALAKSFHISDANVTVDVEDDGALLVSEVLTFDFSGTYSGAYRDIPLKPGETFELVSVSDEVATYVPGGCVQLGCTSSPPGSYGVDLLGDVARVVWHHASADESRTFKLVYRLRGAVRVYDDVADLQLQVWGDQWSVRADRVSAQVSLPGGPTDGDVLVFGHPYGVDGETSLGAGGITPSLVATSVPPYQFVEIRVVFPMGMLASTASSVEIPGDGIDHILAEEDVWAQEADDARRAARNGVLTGLLAFVAIVGGLGGLVYLGYGREPKVDYDREYEQEPPTDLSPAEVGALISQGKVTEKQFTATLFDLIRRGIIHAEPSQVQRVTWGGMRTEEITDLVLSLTDQTTGLRDFEQSVLTVMGRALAEGPRPLHELKDAIRDDVVPNATTYRVFRDRVVEAVKRSGLIDDSGYGISWFVRIGVFVVVVIALFVIGRSVGNNPGGASFAVFAGAGMVAGALVLFALLSFRRVRTRRTAAGALEAARWVAFREYLKDFSRLEEAPPSSLALWDSFLVYGITFGVAEQVLEQARLHAPQELERSSSIYWYGSNGYSGGHTQNAFVGLESALSGAFTPPSSSGGGGGFSGGGGGGSGGGGGGAW